MSLAISVSFVVSKDIKGLLNLSTKIVNKFLNFREIVGRIKTLTGLKEKEIAIQIFDISPQNLSIRKNKNDTPYDKLIAWGVKKNLNLRWLLTGKEPGDEIKPKNDKENNRVAAYRDLEHEKIIAGFKDKPKAREINLMLREIEELSPDGLDRIKEKASDILEGMRLMKPKPPPEKKTGTDDSGPAI